MNRKEVSYVTESVLGRFGHGLDVVQVLNEDGVKDDSHVMGLNDSEDGVSGMMEKG